VKGAEFFTPGVPAFAGTTVVVRVKGAEFFTPWGPSLRWDDGFDDRLIPAPY